ncbi:MAG: sugar phosphate isomerase/epimerase [Clostridia bacterium]|nr:sugar phosphate isomerase/epimerase [Clostridia bacterium]
MLLSVDTNVLRDKYDDITAIKMIKEAGFDAYDYSMFRAKGERDMLGDDYIERARNLRKISDEIGILCRQAHAPFSFQYTNKIDISDPEYLKIVRSMEVASILGAKNIIVHTVKKDLPDGFDLEDYSREFYRSFIPYCEKYNISISVENLVGRHPETKEKFEVFSNPLKHIEFVKSLESKYFNICIDVGHSALLGYMPEDVINAMDSSLFKTIHIHDNDFERDSHVLPYEGKTDWEAVTKALANVGYEGDFSFELEGLFYRLDDALLLAGLKFAEATGRVLIEKIENTRNK